MAKCEPGCTCRRHSKPKGTGACPEGCTCSRHVQSPERRANISKAKKGRPLSDAHRAALACPPGCTCAKHGLRNSGQFQEGSAGFTGRHTEETKAKLSKYRGERASAYRHGWAGTPTYNSWSSMISRCRDESSSSWARYGGRGIVVCDRWATFENFLADMGERPSLDHQIDRIDNDGNYEPTNCQWLTRSENNAKRPDPGGWATRRAR